MVLGRKYSGHGPQATWLGISGSGFPGSFANEGIRRSDDVLLFLGEASFAKAKCLGFAGLNDRVEFLDGISAREKFRLAVAERDLSLLPGFGMCLCHGDPKGDWLQRVKKSQANCLASRISCFRQCQYIRGQRKAET
jgi:hypothetical protein